MAEASENLDSAKRSAGAGSDKSRKTNSTPQSASPKQGISKKVRDYVDRLSDEHRMLVILKAQLYDGTWELMLDDLKNRLAGKPYIFKLVNRINDDIARIEEMQKFEAEHNIDLADYVKM